MFKDAITPKYLRQDHLWNDKEYAQVHITDTQIQVQGRAKKNLAKFSDTCFVRADGLCIGSLRLVGGRKAGNSSMQEFFCTTLYCWQWMVFSDYLI